MQRSTIHAWVQRCSACGTCAPDLGQASAGAEDIIQSPEYLEQLHDPDFPELANSFLCQSMIDDGRDEWTTATWALIHAAWTCDDAGHASQAATCRKRAADTLRKAEANGQSMGEQPGASTVILVDLLRRSDDLDEAAHVIEGTKGDISEEALLKILDYQTELIQAKDLGCHTIAEAFGDEADPGEEGSEQVEQGSSDDDDPVREAVRELVEQPFCELSFGEVDRLFVGLAEIAYRDGVLAWEELVPRSESDWMADEPETKPFNTKEFLAEAVGLAIDGSEPELVRSVLNVWIDSMLYERRVRYRKALEGILSVQKGDHPQAVEQRLKALY
jgi:hypothetical protein